MYMSSIRIYVSPEHEHAVIDVLDSLKGPMTANPHCLSCTISVETDGTGAIYYQEKWRTREALQQHLRSPLFDRVLAAMELSRESPDVAFYNVIESGGLDMVEQARLIDGKNRRVSAEQQS